LLFVCLVGDFCLQVQEKPRLLSEYHCPEATLLSPNANARAGRENKNQGTPPTLLGKLALCATVSGQNFEIECYAN
jgi:hypothetical protein